MPWIQSDHQGGRKGPTNIGFLFLPFLLLSRWGMLVHWHIHRNTHMCTRVHTHTPAYTINIKIIWKHNITNKKATLGNKELVRTETKSWCQENKGQTYMKGEKLSTTGPLIQGEFVLIHTPLLIKSKIGHLEA